MDQVRTRTSEPMLQSTHTLREHPEPEADLELKFRAL